MFSVVEVVTPEVAKEYLSHNIENNRRVSIGKVKGYAADMAAGKWQLTPQGISFNERGELVDGQHRLEAIVRAGVPVPMYVTRGVNNEVFIFDHGTKRTAVDLAEMSGDFDDLTSRDQAKAIALARLAYVSAGHRNTSSIELMQLVKDNKPMIAKALNISRHGAHRPILCSAYGALATFAALYQGLPEEVLTRFSVVANSGFMNSRADSAAVVARKFMTDGWRREFNGNLSDGARRRICEVCCFAIRDFYDGVDRKITYKPSTVSDTPYLGETLSDIIPGGTINAGT